MNKRANVLLALLSTALSLVMALLTKADLSSHNRTFWLAVVGAGSAIAILGTLDALRTRARHATEAETARARHATEAETARMRHLMEMEIEWTKTRHAKETEWVKALHRAAETDQLPMAVFDMSILLRLHKTAMHAAADKSPETFDGEEQKRLEKLMRFLESKNCTVCVPTPVMWELERLGNPSEMVDAIGAFYHMRTAVISPAEKLDVGAAVVSSTADRVILSLAKHRHALLVTQDSLLRRAAEMEGVSVVGSGDLESDLAQWSGLDVRSPPNS
ncbi:MAG: hypothetical protein JWM10_1120 [Myxococcaceae bacterium]|nr:hypothetical protein [Myxococcaceae bacterium]